MRSDELRDAGSLTATALDEVAEVAQGVHRAVAARLFGLAGRQVVPIRYMHDGIAALAYGSTRLGVRYLPPVAGFVAAAVRDPAAESAHDERRGRFVLGAINGFWGDRMAQHQAALAPEMRLRLHGGRLRRVPTNLAADASGNATGRLVVFLHGLCETDLCWSFAAERRWGDRTCTYGSRLRDEDGWTPIYANFNTGLHISANGLELADQLEELVHAWPVHVTEIALVGHSLGGLVARSAAHQADKLGYGWIKPLRHVVGLGTPHLGAPLERAANWGAHRLGRLPETRPFATWLNRRSVGIKDLRYGAVLEQDWLDCDPDELLTDRCTPATLLPGVAYSVASATLSREPSGLFAHDLLVQHSSAHGIGKVRSIPFDRERTFHLGGRKHHFDLLADAMVYDQLRRWLAGADGGGKTADEQRPRRGRLRRPPVDFGL
ncbi:MAG TPA: alpha/beta fold hydrolase [Jatrophihabitans sp.]|nr:alpha/beta fold hydrolase [Jatrophihabitans sp.]